MSLKDGEGNDLKIARAKTNMQLQRNKFMKKAADMIKHHDASKSKNMKVNWKIEGCKDRTVTVGDCDAFRQTSNDIHGTFLGPWADLSF